MKESKEESKQEKPRKYVLERSGERNLVFEGVCLAEVNTREPTGPRQDRYDEYTLYRTVGGKYILFHEYTSHWQGERSYTEAWIGDSAAEVLEQARFEDSDGRSILPDAVVTLADKAGIDFGEHLD